ncbi:hypothetical protein DXG01_000997 [Tephrocybe rancida]|nr:hypothetical protein DXG01_000997 [Tephrocybe rancida]
MTTRIVGFGKIADEKASLNEKVQLTPASTSLDDEKPLPLAEPEESRSTSLFSSWGRRRVDLEAIATQPSVFDDPRSLEVYRPPPQYENVHRFDPKARWTYREERNVLRKLDWRITVWACIMFFALDLDRGNISQANSDNFLDDLNLTTNDFNLGNTLFRLCFLIAELPSQLISKRVGPDNWIPSQARLSATERTPLTPLTDDAVEYRIVFSVLVKGKIIILGLQGGFIPDVVLYLSYFFTKTELPIRLAFFWFSNYISHIVSAFLATGILRLRGVHGKEGWRYLFLIEGLLTLGVGIGAWFLMPAGPTQTKAWHRPKGWFNERLITLGASREETIIVNRVLRDDPTKSDMHNREGLGIRKIFEGLKDWRLWPLYILGIIHQIPVGPPQTYLTLSLRNLGFNTTETNLLSIPSTVLGGLLLLAAAFFSEKVNSRVAATIILQLWALPLLVALYTFDSHTSQWVYYAVVTLITGFPYIHPIQVAWTSRNSNSVRTRTVSASCYNMFVQAGAIVYANIYRTADKPLYKKGNRALIAVASMNIVIYISTFFFYRTINARRDKIWNSWSEREQREYVETTKDEGNQRLDFRFAY